MRTPRYYFTDDFIQFHAYFHNRPHTSRRFRPGDYLWAPEEPFQRIHYIISGAARSAVLHENGRRRILSFHGKGTVFPGYHQHDFRIERSLVTQAISPMEALEFSKDQFQQMFEETPRLRAAVVDWFSVYTNLLLYETAHQEYNSSFLKLCNLLYLLWAHPEKGGYDPVIELTQEDLADLMGVSRVILTRGLAQLRQEGIIRTRRGCLEILDLPALERHCSLETR